jgi:hypothetical protein
MPIFNLILQKSSAEGKISCAITVSDKEGVLNASRIGLAALCCRWGSIYQRVDDREGESLNRG